jgi:dTDP-D-glucose 4,6-dehydratase
MFFGMRFERKLRVSKFLITGGAGFLGASLINYLLKETNYEIISIERPNRQSKFHNNDRVKIVYHDLCNPLENDQIKNAVDIEYVIHFASLTNIKTSIKNPESFVINNVLGTTHLLEFARKSTPRLKRFLYFSTAEIFGRAPVGEVLNENSLIEAHSPYAATKIGAQEMCLSYKNTFNLPVVIVYVMNTFGPLQSKEKYIPLIVKKIIREEKVAIHLNKSATAPNRRNYLYVDDLCDAILFLNNHATVGEKYVVASPEESDNLKIAQIVASLLDKELNYELVKQKQNSLALPRLSGKKLYELGWRPEKTLKEGLEEFIKQKRENR